LQDQKNSQSLQREKLIAVFGVAGGTVFSESSECAASVLEKWPAADKFPELKNPAGNK